MWRVTTRTRQHFAIGRDQTSGDLGATDVDTDCNISQIAHRSHGFKASAAAPITPASLPSLADVNDATGR